MVVVALMKSKLLCAGVVVAFVMCCCSNSYVGRGTVDYGVFGQSPVWITDHFFELADRAVVYVYSDGEDGWEYVAEGEDLGRLVGFLKRNPPNMVCFDGGMRAEAAKGACVFLEKRRGNQLVTYARLMVTPKFFLRDGEASYLGIMRLVKGFKKQGKSGYRSNGFMESDVMDVSF